MVFYLILFLFFNIYLQNLVFICRFFCPCAAKTSVKDYLLLFCMIWDFQSAWLFVRSDSGVLHVIKTLLHSFTSSAQQPVNPSAVLSLVRPLGCWVFTEAIAFKCFTQGQLHRPLEESTLMQQWSNCQNNQAAPSYAAQLMHCVSSRCTLIKTLMGLLLQVQTFWTLILSSFIDAIYKELYFWDIICPINMPFDKNKYLVYRSLQII